MKIKSTTRSTPFGEDPHKILAVVRKGAPSEIIAQVEKATLIWYRFRLREAFETNQAVMSIVTAHDPAANAFEAVKLELNALVRSESEDVFDSALREILAELDDLRAKPSSMYLVDGEGKTSLAIRPEHIYQPPDYIDEGGNRRKARPIVHPGITAPLILKRYNTDKEAELVSKSGPRAAMALQHITDQSSVTKRANHALKELGVETSPLETEKQTLTIEFGHEQSDGALQSFNPSFHRAHAFGQLLARKILSELKETKCCYISSVELKTGAKKRWYVATVDIPSAG